MADGEKRGHAGSASGEQQKTDSSEESKKQESPILAMCPPLVQLTDRFGNTFFFGNAGDYWHPPYPLGSDTDYRTHVRKIREMEIRPDDVLLCSFPKTGTHWHMEIVRMLLNKKAEYIDDDLMVKSFIDMSPAEVVAQLPSPRMLITHVPFRHIPKQALEKKIKIVYLDRNPKDVVVSYYCQVCNSRPPLQYPGTFEQFFYTYLECGFYYGDFFDHLTDWKKEIEAHPEMGVYTSVFEEMKEDPIGGVKKLNEYLGTGNNDQLCEDIAKACSFKSLKAAKDEKAQEMLRKLMPGTTMTFYRKGNVGDWKNWFTVAMDEFYEAEYKRRMSGYAK